MQSEWHFQRDLHCNQIRRHLSPSWSLRPRHQKHEPDMQRHGQRILPAKTQHHRDVACHDVEASRVHCSDSATPARNSRCAVRTNRSLRSARSSRAHRAICVRRITMRLRGLSAFHFASRGLHTSPALCSPPSSADTAARLGGRTLRLPAAPARGNDALTGHAGSARDLPRPGRGANRRGPAAAVQASSRRT